MKQINNQFTTWEFSEQEEKESHILSPLAVAKLQNLLAEYSSGKVSMTFNPNEVLQYAQAEAEFQGQIGILKMLLADHEDAVRVISTSVTN